MDENLAFSADPRAAVAFITQQPAIDTLLGELQVRDLEEWAVRLELSVFFVANLEAVAELGIEDTATMISRSDEFIAVAARRAHRTVPEMHALFNLLAERIQPPPPPDALPFIDFGKFLPSILVAPVRSLLALCPLPALEQLAATHAVESLGHRCRIACDWLQSFLRRADPAIDRQAHVIGIAYADGRLGVSEVAALLRISTADAVAWLEDHGHCRAHSKLPLTPNERGRSFARLRDDRLRREGRAEPDDGLIRRDVIATQRIEGVDARSWLRQQ